ncbi:MAG: ABC transporter substrate-binding protein [Paenibacillaceae bacterium]|nr:ABC transporter substrate-binding protein [Paenibacillaceae bacterium]
MTRTAKLCFHALIICSLAVALAACGSGGDKVGGAASSSSPTFSAGQSTAGPSSAGPRSFKDVLGEVSVPAVPQRIVAPYVEDALVTLGVKPTMQWSLGPLVQDYLQPYLPDVPKLDFTNGVNMEALLSADPDLIVLYTKQLAADGAIDKFKKIAPTYTFDDATVDWKGTLRVLGDVLNKKDAAEKAIQDYDRKVSEAKQRLEPVVKGKTFAVIRIKPKEVLLMDGTYYSGPVLYGDLGLQPHKMVRELSWELNKPISQEVLPQLDADYIFYMVQGEAARPKANEWLADPIWKSVPAVKQGHVFEVDANYWMASGAIANGKKIDDVLKHLGK